MAGMGIICLDVTGGKLANLFTLQLETQGARIGKLFHQGISEFLAGLESLRGVVTAGILCNSPQAKEEFDKGVEFLSSSVQLVGGIIDAVILAKRLLFEQKDQDDLIIRRETIFPHIDYDTYYKKLLSSNAVLKDRLLWNDMASHMRKDGAKGGLKLLEQTFAELQQELHGFIGEVKVSRGMPVLELSDRLHHMAVPVASLLVKWMKPLSYCIYFTLIAEEAATILKKKEGL